MRYVGPILPEWYSPSTHASPIQSAIDEAAERGGGEVRLGNEVYEIETGLVVRNNNVKLVGQGSGHMVGGKATTRATAASRILWVGSAGVGTVLTFDSNPDDDGSEEPKSGGGISGIMLDGGELALNCLEVKSWHRGRFDDVHSCYARDYGYKLWTLENGVLSGSGTTTNNVFTGIQYSEVNTGQNPVGMVLATQAATNCCFNRFIETQITMNGSGVGLSLENTDNNSFFGGKVGHRLGSTTAEIVLHADDTGALSPNSHCRYNTFHSVEGRYRAKASIAGTDHSFRNMIIGLPRSNGMPLPIIEAGADLRYWATTGEFV